MCRETLSSVFTTSLCGAKVWEDCPRAKGMIKSHNGNYRSRGSGLLFSHHCIYMQIFFILISHDNIACVASVSSRVMVRKLEREQKKKCVEGGWGGYSSTTIPFFFCSRPNFSWRTRAETLATQANRLLTQANDTVPVCIERKDNTRRGGPSPLPLKRNRGDPVSGHAVAVHSIPSFQTGTGSRLPCFPFPTDST